MFGVSDVHRMTNPSEVLSPNRGHGTPGRTVTARSRVVGGRVVPTFPSEPPISHGGLMTKKLGCLMMTFYGNQQTFNGLHKFFCSRTRHTYWRNRGTDMSTDRWGQSE